MKKVASLPAENLLWSKYLRSFLQKNEELLILLDWDTLLIQLETFEKFCLTNSLVEQLQELSHVSERKIVLLLLASSIMFIFKIIRNNPSVLMSLYGYHIAIKLTRLEMDYSDSNSLLLTYWIMYSSLELWPYSSSFISFRNLIKLLIYNTMQDKLKRAMLLKVLFKPKMDQTNK